MAFPHQPLSHMSAHIVFGAGGVKPLENLPNLLDKFTTEMPLSRFVKELGSHGIAANLIPPAVSMLAVIEKIALLFG